jgi:DNA-binding LacI/PurR family transcriptional regulator
MVDKFKVGYLAAEHLIMLGHRRICYLSSGEDVSGEESRHGYRQALDDYGVPFRQELLINLSVRSSAEPAREAILGRLRENPRYCTAIATPQLAMAYGACRALRQLEMRIGEEVALVGNNLCDNPELEHLPYTYQPYDDSARAAVELLLDEPDPQTHRKHVLIPPKLIVPDGRLDGQRKEI